jgi:hypothetical protein
MATSDFINHKRSEKMVGRGGGDRKDKLANKVCALNVLRPRPLSNWNKRNRRQVSPPWDSGTVLTQVACVEEFIGGGGLLIHPDLFARTDFRLFCLRYELLSCTKTPHLQPNAYQVLTKNLSDLAAVFKTALEHAVALL